MDIHLRAKISKKISLQSLSRVKYITRVTRMITLLSLCGEKLIPRTLLNIMIQKVESRSSKANSLKRIDLHQAWCQGRKRKSSPKESIHHLLRYCVARIRRESKHGSKLRNSNF